MKRRTFLAGSAAAISAITLNSLSFENGLRVGVISSIFNFSGYSNVQLTSIVQYTSHKEAYADLDSGKIDALITSPGFLAAEKPEFSLFQFPSVDGSQWIESNYALVSAHHAENGFASRYLGAMSPLMIRISNLNMEKLADWKSQPKKVSIAASGSRAVWFEHLGFNVQNSGIFSRLSAQLAELSNGYLDISDAFPPALFLQSLLHNSDIGISMNFSRNAVLVIDGSTKGPLPLEVVSRKEKSASLNALQVSLQTAIKEDDKFQNQMLEMLREKSGLQIAQGLPAPLLLGLENCKQLNLNFISSLNSTGSDLIKGFNSKRSV